MTAHDVVKRMRELRPDADWSVVPGNMGGTAVKCSVGEMSAAVSMGDQYAPSIPAVTDDAVLRIFDLLYQRVKP